MADLKSVLVGCTAITFVVLGLNSGQAASSTLGVQNFVDGSFITGVAAFDSGSAADPSPFQSFNGSDFGGPFAASWTFNFAATPVSSATITFGIFDNDSQASGLQVASF